MLACSRVTYRAPRGSSDANRRMMVLVRPDQEASVLSSLSAEERSVLLTELLRAHPELRAEAETITTTLLRAGDNGQITDDVARKLRGLHISELADRASDQQDGQAAPSYAVAAEMLAEVVQPYLEDIARRARLGARRAAADIGIAVLLGLYECREDTGDDLILTQTGLPDAVDDFARTVYKALRAAHLILPASVTRCR
jgi:hypothetical protein